MSELVTNAVVHGAGPISSRCDARDPRGHRRHRRWLATTGHSGEGPGADALAGRGLWMLVNLADDWGLRADADTKTIWFAMANRSPDLTEPLGWSSRLAGGEPVGGGDQGVGEVPAAVGRLAVGHLARIGSAKPLRADAQPPSAHAVGKVLPADLGLSTPSVEVGASPDPRTPRTPRTPRIAPAISSPTRVEAQGSPIATPAAPNNHGQGNDPVVPSVSDQRRRPDLESRRNPV